MSRKDVDLVLTGYEAWDRGDIETAFAPIDKDFEFHEDPQYPEMGVYRGRKVIKENASKETGTPLARPRPTKCVWTSTESPRSSIDSGLDSKSSNPEAMSSVRNLLNASFPRTGPTPRSGPSAGAQSTSGSMISSTPSMSPLAKAS